MLLKPKFNMRKLAFLIPFVLSFALFSISARADVLYNQSFINHTFSCAESGCIAGADVIGEQFDINNFFGTTNITGFTVSLSGYTPNPTDAVVYFFNNSGGGNWQLLAQSIGYVHTIANGYDWYNFSFVPFQMPQNNFGEALFGLLTRGATSIPFNDANGNDSLNIGYDGYSQTYVSSLRLATQVGYPARQEDLALRVYNGSVQYQFYYVTGCTTSPTTAPAQISCSPPSIPIPSTAVAGSIVVREVTNILLTGSFSYNNPSFAVQTCTPNTPATCNLNSQTCAPSTLGQPYTWYNYTYQAGNTASGYSAVNIPQGCFDGNFYIQGNLIVSALVTNVNDSVNVINQTVNTITQVCSNGIQTTSYGNGTLVSTVCTNGCKDQYACNIAPVINPTQTINGANANDQVFAIVNAILTPMGIGTIAMMVIAVMLASAIKRDSGIVFAGTIIVMSTFFSVVGIYPIWVAVVEIVLTAFGVVIFANKLRG